MTDAEIDRDVTGNGSNPCRELPAFPQQAEIPVPTDERLLRGILRQCGIAQPAPRHGVDPSFVALDQLAKALGIAMLHGFDCLLVLMGEVGGFRRHVSHW